VSRTARTGEPPEFWLGEILDQQLLDRDQRRMGMVDGLVLELAEGRPPRVTWILVGGVTLGRRLSAPISRLVVGLACRWGGQRGKPWRIPWSAVREVGVDITVDLDARGTPALYWEELLRRFVRRLPGS
jgi:hypothetical protein